MTSAFPFSLGEGFSAAAGSAVGEAGAEPTAAILRVFFAPGEAEGFPGREGTAFGAAAFPRLVLERFAMKWGRSIGALSFRCQGRFPTPISG